MTLPPPGGGGFKTVVGVTACFRRCRCWRPFAREPPPGGLSWQYPCEVHGAGSAQRHYTMTGLYSVILRIAGKANVPLFAYDTLFQVMT